MLELTIHGISAKDKNVYRLEHGVYTIGRGRSADIKILKKAISREHARISYSEKEIRITDLKSVNGLFVNGVKISESRLFNGDRVSIKAITIDITCEFNKEDDAHILDTTGLNDDRGNTDIQPGRGIETKRPGGMKPVGKKELSDIFQTEANSLKLESQASKDLFEGSDGDNTFTFSDTELKKTSRFTGSGGTVKSDPFTDLNFTSMNGGMPGGDRTGVVSRGKKSKDSGGIFTLPVRALNASIINPVVSILLQFDYKLLVFILMALSTALIALFVLFPQKTNMENYLRNEALTNAENIAYFLAAENREAVIRRDYERLNLATAMKVRNVQHARIIRRDGKIVAPVSERYRDVSGVYLNAAVHSMQKGEVAEIQKISGKPFVFSVVSPIKAFTDDELSFSNVRSSTVSQEEIIGLAQIEYTTEGIFSGNPYRGITIEAFAMQILYCLLIGFMISYFIIKLTAPVFSKLKDDLKRAGRSSSIKIKPYINLRELDDFLETLEEFIASGRGTNISSRSDGTEFGDEGSAQIFRDDSMDAFNCALQVVEGGIVVMDNEEKIIIANENFGRMMQCGGRESVEGQQLSNIISDIDTLDKIKSLKDRLSGSEETRVSETVDMAGFDTNIVAARSSGGNFTAILFKENII